MLPLKRVKMTDWKGCEPGDIIFAKAQGQTAIGFVFEWSGSKHVTFFTGEMVFKRHQLTEATLSRVSYKISNLNLPDSILVDMTSAAAATSVSLDFGDLCLVGDQAAVLIDHMGDEIAVGLDGICIPDVWGRQPVIIKAWSIRLLDDVMDPVTLFTRESPAKPT